MARINCIKLAPYGAGKQTFNKEIGVENKNICYVHRQKVKKNQTLNIFLRAEMWQRAWCCYTWTYIGSAFIEFWNFLWNIFFFNCIYVDFRQEYAVQKEQKYLEAKQTVEEV